MNKIYLGKLVSTHGIKGELKLLSNFEYLDRVLENDFIFYIDDNKYLLNTFRKHKQYILISFKNYNNINDILFLVGKEVFINKDNLNLKEDEYLLSDLPDSLVIEDEKILGKITEVLLGNKNNFIRVEKDNLNFIIPLIKEYVIKYDCNEKKLYTKNAKSLI